MANMDYSIAAQKALEAMKVKYTVEDRILEDGSPCWEYAIAMPSESIAGLKVRVSLTPDGDVRLRSSMESDLPEELRMDMLETMNGLMSRFRFVRLTMDREGNVWAGYDFFLVGGEEEASVSLGANLLLFRDIADKYRDRILRVRWGKKKEAEQTPLKLDLFGSEEG